MDQAGADLAYRNGLEEPHWLVLAILGWGDWRDQRVGPISHRGLGLPGASPV